MKLNEITDFLNRHGYVADGNDYFLGDLRITVKPDPYFECSVKAESLVDMFDEMFLEDIRREARLMLLTIAFSESTTLTMVDVVKELVRYHSAKLSDDKIAGIAADVAPPTKISEVNYTCIRISAMVLTFKGGPYCRYDTFVENLKSLGYTQADNCGIVWKTDDSVCTISDDHMWFETLRGQVVPVQELNSFNLARILYDGNNSTLKDYLIKKFTNAGMSNVDVLVEFTIDKGVWENECETTDRSYDEVADEYIELLNLLKSAQ